MRRTWTLVAAMALVALAGAAPARAAWEGTGEPTLEARAILPADASAPAPFPGAPDTEPQPRPRRRASPSAGSARCSTRPGATATGRCPTTASAPRRTRARSCCGSTRSRRTGETARGGDGEVEIKDVDHAERPGTTACPSTSSTSDTRERLLTGGDFDLESVRVDRRGDLWFGEEFGPYLLHTDRRGRVQGGADPAARRPLARTPPAPGTPNLARSNGFEGMALSDDGRTLRPVLEGPVTGDDPTVRRVYEFDLDRKPLRARLAGVPRRAPGATWSPTSRCATTTASSSLERDNGRGPRRAPQAGVRGHADAATGRCRSAGIADLLDLRDPARISLPGAPGRHRPGRPVLACRTRRSKSVLPLGEDRLAIVNDTNFGSRGRNPDLPDYSDFIVISTPRPQPRRADAGDHRRHAVRRRAGGRLPAARRRRQRRPGRRARSSTSATSRTAAAPATTRASSACAPSTTRSRTRSCYTPGDNEWTDCHRPAAGGYVPTERLARLRAAVLPRDRDPRRLPARAVRREPALVGRGRDVRARARGRQRQRARAPGSAAPRRRRSAPSGSPRSTPARRRRSSGSTAPSTPRSAARARGVVIGMQADTFARQHRVRPHQRPARAARAPIRAARAAAPGRHARVQDRPAARRRAEPRPRRGRGRDRERVAPPDGRPAHAGGVLVAAGAAAAAGHRRLVQHPPRRRHRRPARPRAGRRRDRAHRRRGRRPAGGRPALGRPQRVRRPGAVARRPARHAASSTAPTSTSTRPRPIARGASTARRSCPRTRSSTAATRCCRGRENGEQRGLLEAAIDVDGTRVRVANTHLQHNSAVERRAQTERIAELLAPVAHAGDPRSATSTRRPARPSSRRSHRASPTPGRAAGPATGSPIPPPRPTARIDYVLTTHDVDVASARTLSLSGLRSPAR